MRCLALFRDGQDGVIQTKSNFHLKKVEQWTKLMKQASDTG